MKYVGRRTDTTTPFCVNVYSSCKTRTRNTHGEGQKCMINFNPKIRREEITWNIYE